MIELLVEGRLIHDVGCVGYGNGRRRRAAFGMNGDCFVGDLDWPGGNGTGTLFPEFHVLIDHGVAAGRVQFLDLVPADRHVAERIGVECDLAAGFIDELTVQRVSIAENQNIRACRLRTRECRDCEAGEENCDDGKCADKRAKRMTENTAIRLKMRQVHGGMSSAVIFLVTD